MCWGTKHLLSIVPLIVFLLLVCAAGENRVFKLAPGEPRAGLQSGDVITLRQRVSYGRAANSLNMLLASV